MLVKEKGESSVGFKPRGTFDWSNIYIPILGIGVEFNIQLTNRRRPDLVYWVGVGLDICIYSYIQFPLWIDKHQNISWGWNGSPIIDIFISTSCNTNWRWQIPLLSAHFLLKMKSMFWWESTIILLLFMILPIHDFITQSIYFDSYLWCKFNSLLSSPFQTWIRGGSKY